MWRVYHFRVSDKMGLSLSSFHFGASFLTRLVSFLTLTCNQVSLRCYHSWSAYHPLLDLQAELEASISALVQLNQRSHERSLQAYLLVARRLRNLTSEDETSLGFKELLKAVEPTSNVFHTVNMMQLELFVLFQDWEDALPCLTEAPDTRNRFLAMHASARGMFLEALVYLKTSS